MPDDAMLTVLMATHNGAATLPAALDALARVEDPTGGWRLIVVDNGSTDETPTIVSSFENRLPLTFLREPVRGQNRARNAGLARATGDLVVFTDDDVLPRPDWLVQLRSAAIRHADFAVFGGVIVPRWEVPPKAWILKAVPLAPAFAVTDPTLPEGPTRPGHVFSPNMAIRRSVFEAGYRFDETIGPSAGEYAMGSETDLNRRLAVAGYRAWHSKAAVVEHLIPAGHMNAEWILARAIRYGRGTYRWSGATPGARTRHSRARLLQFVVRRAAVHGFRLARETWCGDPTQVFVHQWQLRVLLGYAAEAGLTPWRRPAMTGAWRKGMGDNGAC